MLKVKLVGFTQDQDGWAEPLCAAAARASRDPAPLDVLLKAAQRDIGKARDSNDRIVHGMGHASIAEHCCFHFHVMGLSRFMVEALEWHRLASYTEKSQRYQTMGQDDRMVPAEYKQRPEGTKGLWSDLVVLQDRAFSLYQQMVDAGVPGEDARYVLPLSCTAQVAVTINARNLGRMLRRLRMLKIAEASDLADDLEKEAKAVAPSLVRHAEPSTYEDSEYDRMQALEACLQSDYGVGPEEVAEDADVQLEDVFPDEDFWGEATIVRDMLERQGFERHMVNWKMLREHFKGCGGWPTDLFDLLQTALFGGMGPYDAAPREFEGINLTYRVHLSASAFAQMKRHRMMTLLPMPYGLDCYFPARVGDWGGTMEGSQALTNIQKESGNLMMLAKAAGVPPEYAALNATQRDCIIHLDLRELYAMSRLREDGHAQAEIRARVTEMSRQAREALPLLASRLGGKDVFGKKE
jgi:flavin-dependent thymidylate synthase